MLTTQVDAIFAEAAVISGAIAFGVTLLLSQIRSYQNQLGTRALEPVQNPGAIDFGQSAAVKAPSFGETLQNAA